MKYKIEDYFLEFRHPFKIAHGTRTGTDIVLLTVEYNGIFGIGEASLPPYLSETKQSVRIFIEDVIANIDLRKTLQENLQILHSTNRNYAAKAAIDIALHNYYAAQESISVRELLHINENENPLCTFTIGMGDKDETAKKLEESEQFRLLKVKLGGKDDREIVNNIRAQTRKLLCVDVNQGWRNRETALEMIEWLNERDILFVEQPMPKEMMQEMACLYENSSLPLIADESVQVPEVVIKMKNHFHGINIKLMKCGGLSPAIKMIHSARALGMKVLIGSMSETGCGIHAAAQLAPLADFVDLDGPVLTRNNPFDWVRYEDGKIIPRNL